MNDLLEKLDDLYGRIVANPGSPSTHLAELTKLICEALAAATRPSVFVSSADVDLTWRHKKPT